jgi:zinc transport system permease protein
MFEIFTLGFMQRAVIVALCISVITPMIGNTIVLKRLSTIGDALSHAGLAGVAIGLCMSLNPVFSAVIFAAVAAVVIELIRRSFPNYSELATAIVLSLGVGTAAVFSGFVKNSATFNSFLFGSIVAISETELYAVIILSIAVFIILLLLYRELLYIAFDEEGATLSGVNVGTINLVFTILTAIVVSIAARTVGSLVISSLMVIPVACSMLVSKSYKQNMVLSVLFAMFFTIAGLLVSTFYDLKPGGTIVLIGIGVLVVVLLFGRRK